MITHHDTLSHTCCEHVCNVEKLAWGGANASLLICGLCVALPYTELSPVAPLSIIVLVMHELRRATKLNFEANTMQSLAGQFHRYLHSESEVKHELEETLEKPLYYGDAITVCLMLVIETDRAMRIYWYIVLRRAISVLWRQTRQPFTQLV